MEIPSVNRAKIEEGDKKKLNGNVMESTPNQKEMTQ